MTEKAAYLPGEVGDILLRALTWCGDQIAPEQREVAWKWVEDHSDRQEDMGAF